VFLRELRVQYRLRRVRGKGVGVERLSSPSDCSLAFRRLLGDEAVEVCGVFCLSTRFNVLAYHELSRGTLDTTLVFPREVFKVALLANARSIVVGHNHPSGDPTPSPEDIAISTRLHSAGGLLGVDLVDHIIVAGETFLSLRDAGYLPITPIEG
jgi:DNA repair protein RadC